MKERLQKLLAQANVASRRASEEWITQGRVRVNGELARLGDKADPATDTITVDGTRLNFETQKRIYIALNKPKQVLSTDKPHRGDKRETIKDLIPLDERLVSVGRLDADSEGLVVLTNDGDLAYRLTHPRFRHTKTYRVDVIGLPTAETLEKWQQGVFLEDGKTAPCFVEIVHGSVKITTLRIVMTEGKKRQIRRVASSFGHPVRRLIRTHIGMLPLGELAAGAWRELTPREVIALSTPAPELKLFPKALRHAPAEKPPAPAPAEPAPRRPARTSRRDSSSGQPPRRSARRDQKPRSRRDRPR